MANGKFLSAIKRDMILLRIMLNEYLYLF